MAVKSISVSGLNVGDTATLFVRKTSESTANETSYTRASSSDSSSHTWQINVDYDVEYTYSIRVTASDGTVTWPVSGATFVEHSPTQASYSISSVTTNSVTASISNLSSGASVVFRVLQIANGSIIGSSSGTASSSSMSLTVSGLTPNTRYNSQVLVGGSSIGYSEFTTAEDTTPSFTYKCGYNYITITFKNYSSSTKIRVEVDGQSASRTGNGDVTISGLKASTDYECYIYLNGSSSFSDAFAFTTLDAEFEWDTNIATGVRMSIWQNPANGNIFPAPVTASEWNRLVALVNKKCGTSIDTVSSGTRMLASSGKNVRLVADALGVAVSSGDIVTAQFFIDLADAINSYGS